MVKTDLRQAVVERDGAQCQSCGKKLVLDKYEEGPTAHVHHITPKAEGGQDTLQNLETLCRDCHLQKHDHGVGGDYTDLRDQILSLLERNGGFATTGYLVDKLKCSRPAVTKRLDRLYAGGYIEYVHQPTAFWRLKNDPREEEDARK